MSQDVAFDSFAPNPNFADGLTFRSPPPGTIARGQLPLHYEPTPVDAVRAGEELKNPFSEADPVRLARGSVVFANFCQVCHGPTRLRQYTRHAARFSADPVADGGAGAGNEGRADVPRAHVRAGEHAGTCRAAFARRSLVGDPARASACSDPMLRLPNPVPHPCGCRTLPCTSRRTARPVTEKTARAT